MYKGCKILGIIPARGGSKGIPGKNLRQVAGKSLLAWTAAAAHASAYLDRVILSSEDAQIIAQAKSIGLEVPFVRPAELAQDTTPGIAPVLHAIKELERDGYSHIALLQPTSPLRQAWDIDGAIAQCIDAAAPSCVSVCETPHPPGWLFRINNENRLLPLLDSSAMPARRQDAPKTFQLNGAVYVASTTHLLKTKSFICPESVAFVMPQERSLDIDAETDLLLAEILIKQAAQALPQIQTKTTDE